MLGAVVEAHPVVPIARGPLSIGIFGYRGRLHFGFYADPQAFPEVAGAAPSTLHSEAFSSLRVQRKRGRSRRGRPFLTFRGAELAV